MTIPLYFPMGQPLFLLSRVCTYLPGILMSSLQIILSNSPSVNKILVPWMLRPAWALFRPSRYSLLELR